MALKEFLITGLHLVLVIENHLSVNGFNSKLSGINPFVPNTSFLYSLKISENLTVFWYFQWVERVHFLFSSIRVFFKDNEDSQNSVGREGTIFYSTLTLPPAHEHWDIYLQLCIWDDYHLFLIATLVFTRLLLDEIYHLIELLFEWLIDDAMFVCLLDELILGFCYSNLALETGEFELALTITLVLQANRLTKCALET